MGPCSNDGDCTHGMLCYDQTRLLFFAPLRGHGTNSSDPGVCRCDLNVGLRGANCQTFTPLTWIACIATLLVICMQLAALYTTSWTIYKILLARRKRLLRQPHFGLLCLVLLCSVIQPIFFFNFMVRSLSMGQKEIVGYPQDQILDIVTGLLGNATLLAWANSAFSMTRRTRQFSRKQLDLGQRVLHLVSTVYVIVAALLLATSVKDVDMQYVLHTTVFILLAVLFRVGKAYLSTVLCQADRRHQSSSNNNNSSTASGSLGVEHAAVMTAEDVVVLPSYHDRAQCVPRSFVRASPVLGGLILGTSQSIACACGKSSAVHPSSDTAAEEEGWGSRQIELGQLREKRPAPRISWMEAEEEEEDDGYIPSFANSSPIFHHILLTAQIVSEQLFWVAVGCAVYIIGFQRNFILYSFGSNLVGYFATRIIFTILDFIHFMRPRTFKS